MPCIALFLSRTDFCAFEIPFLLLIGWNEVQDTVENTDRYSTVKKVRSIYWLDPSPRI